MPAPVNISAATAIEIGPLPASISQNVNDAGTTYTVWYKYSATVDGLIQIFGFGDLVTYKPTLRVFSPDGTTQFMPADATNLEMQLPVTSGQIYYFRFTSSTGNVGAATLLLTAAAFAPTTAPIGSIAVSDDTTGLPLVLLDVSDALPRQYLQPFPAGEQADILNDGTVCTEDISGAASDDIKVGLYDSTLALILTNTYNSANGWQRTYISSNRTTQFYLGWSADYDNFAGEPSYRTINAAGAVSGWTKLQGQGMTGLAPSNDEATLYYSGDMGGNNRPIKRWNITGGVGLADLVANMVGYTPQTIEVLADGTLIVLYVNGSLDTVIKHYSAAGATLDTLNLGSSGDPRLASSADQTSFWVWLKPTVSPGGAMTGVSQFKNLQSDGTVLTSLSSNWYEKGVYGAAATATPVAGFGHSESCPFWLTRSAFPASPPATTFPTIEDISQTMNCVRPGIQVVTITGTGFADGDTVTITDPEGNPVEDVTVTVVSDTEITTQFTASSFGAYCFTVTSPDDLSSHTVCTTAICEDTQTIRRLRRTTHISNENLWTYFDSLTVAYEAGTGLTSGQGSDPKLMLRWSDDGGHAWSQWHAIEIGKLGEYKHRAIWRRLGRSRNRTWELVHSDPTKIVLIDGYLDLKQGTS